MHRQQVAAAATDLPPLVHGRKASWFELFFDLVFVVAVAQLSGAYAHHFDWAGAAGSMLLLLAMWWCWLGHTFHATRFDEQRRGQRLLGLAQIGAVTAIGYGVADAFGTRGVAFACGVAAFKALLALAYVGERRWAGARGLIRAYASLYAVQAALWAGSALLEPKARLAAWCAALALDLVSPWWVARFTTRVQPHPEHLPERFGLFTIILLGEGMASVVHALDHGGALTTQALAAAALGAVVTFLCWVGYFEFGRAHGERHVASAAQGRRLRLWAYGHVPLYVGIASLAAGTVALAGAPDWSAALLGPYAAGLALMGLGLVLLRRASTPASA
jgi:low temperature requirement protein LtrA